uniref:Putative secreted protein n=1 Tax=Anopheles darlingi TaxID=43151 RepID=A0A2M4DNU4_ANODA
MRWSRRVSSGRRIPAVAALPVAVAAAAVVRRHRFRCLSAAGPTVETAGFGWPYWQRLSSRSVADREWSKYSQPAAIEWRRR